MLQTVFSRRAEIITASVGALQTNCYIVFNKSNILVVDPGAEGNLISNFLKHNFKDPKVDVFLTHGHFDHIGGVPDICKEFPDAKITISKKEWETPMSIPSHLPGDISIENTLKPLKDRINLVVENDIVKIEDEEFKVMELPGHTPGSVGLYGKDSGALFIGDTLFKGSIGKTQSIVAHKELIKSVIEKVLVLPIKTQVFPGHGGETTVGNEIKHNPYVGKSKEE